MDFRSYDSMEGIAAIELGQPSRRFESWPQAKLIHAVSQTPRPEEPREARRLEGRLQRPSFEAICLRQRVPQDEVRVSRADLQAAVWESPN